MLYSAGGQRASLTDGTGTTSFGYDALGRMTSVEAPQTGSVGYGYDARGLRTQLTYPDSTVIDYHYFPDGQLQQASQNGSPLATMATVRLASSWPSSSVPMAR